MSTKRKIWLLSLVYLFISITVGFLNKANSQQLADQPLDWMSQVKTAISSTSLQNEFQIYADYENWNRPTGNRPSC